MAALVVKIALALFACITAILSIADIKNMRDKDDQNHFWFKRLTRWGKVKLGFAITTLFLVAFNEYISYSDAAAGAVREVQYKKRLEATLSDTDKRATEGRQALGASILHIRALGTQNEYLVRSLDGLRTRYGTVRLPSDYQNLYTDIVIEKRGKYLPRHGDLIEWQFICHTGAFPNLPERKANSGTCHRPYGYLTANGEIVHLTAPSGHSTFPETRSTGGVMRYTSPSETEECLVMADALKGNSCELRLDIAREARYKFTDQQTPSDLQNQERAVEDVCRKYEALYGRSCRDIIP